MSCPPRSSLSPSLTFESSGPPTNNASSKSTPAPVRASRPLHRASAVRKGQEPKSSPAAPPHPDAVCMNCQCGHCDALDRHGRCAFHPGHLQDETYEFVGFTRNGREVRTLRTLTMWTCCAEEPGAPGCAEAKAHQSKP
ncbi:hypothetical protein GGX14DRAFT_586035 [Mycena pura]|uniref:Uncharacterized protein n=1 Tax=Mycena pura TaxID=153505 RepID=A0AAD6VWQ5_9AGAR|nr:hypothetical protein GGX14DRAFT_586035 [Mycena pura]